MNAATDTQSYNPVSWVLVKLIISTLVMGVLFRLNLPLTGALAMVVHLGLVGYSLRLYFTKRQEESARFLLYAIGMLAALPFFLILFTALSGNPYTLPVYATSALILILTIQGGILACKERRFGWLYAIYAVLILYFLVLPSAVGAV